MIITPSDTARLDAAATVREWHAIAHAIDPGRDWPVPSRFISPGEEPPGPRAWDEVDDWVAERVAVEACLAESLVPCVD
jgi:hypothetical protein